MARLMLKEFAVLAASGIAMLAKEEPLGVETEPWVTPFWVQLERVVKSVKSLLSK